MSAIYDCECDSFEMYEEQDSFEMAEAVPGPGVPSGGLTGQVLKKRSDEDFDTEWADESGGGGGTSDYTQLSNKPQINGNTLTGNKFGADLGLVNAETGKGLSTNDYTTADKNKLSGIEAQANKTVIDSTLTNAGQAADAKATGDAVSELRNTLDHKADVIYDTASGDIASFPDGADGLPVKDLTIAIEPVQDLHGYDNPWPAGGGKNLLVPHEVQYDSNGITITTVKDSNNNIIGYNINGTATANGYCTIWGKGLSDNFSVIAGKTLKIYGGPNSNSNLYVQCASSNGLWGNDTTGGGSNTFTVEATEPSNWNAQIVYKNGAVINNKVLYPMVCLATDSGTFAPYSNICPISGWTGANITSTGKNLLKLVGQTQKIRGVQFTVNSDGTITANGTASANLNYVAGEFNIPDNSVILSGSTGGSDDTYYLQIVNDAQTTQIGVSNDGDTTIPIAANTTYLCRIRVILGATLSNVTFKPMVRRISEPDSTFEPFGDTYSISWQSEAGTVYGGTLDVTTGVLTVDRAKITVTSLTRNTATAYYTIPPVGAKGEDFTTVISDKVNTAPNGVSAGIFINNVGAIRLNTPVEYSSAADCIAAYGGSFDVCFELTTPQTYQLDPVTVTTLLGQNNIWADCGPSTVEYPCDTKLYIERLTAPEEDDMIANQNIASGVYFMVGNNLYLSTTAILAGDPIKPGTNCTLTNLAAALNALNS